MAIKWFDLKDAGAKLERRQAESGEFFVRLSLQDAVSPEKMHEAASLGWIPADADKAGKEFSNFGKVSRLSELVSMVSVFLPEETILKGKTDVSKLRQGEEVKGFTDPAALVSNLTASRESVAQNIERLPEHVRERIIARVDAAQKLLGGEPDVAGALFQNDGIRLWKRLSDQYGVRSATQAMAGVLAVAQYKGEDFRQVHDALLRAAETGSGLPEITGRAQYRAEAVISHLDSLKEIHEAVAPGAWSESRFYQSFPKHFRANYRVWDGAAIDHTNETDKPEIVGAKFYADPAFPTGWKKDMAFRVSSAIHNMANTLGVLPRDLLSPKGNRMIHLGNIPTSEARGYARSSEYKMGGERVNVQAIKITPFDIGVFVHELGHAIDFNIRNGWGENASPEVLRAILDGTGVRKEINAFLDVARSKNLFSDKHLAYLEMPEEMIARSFEASMQDHAEIENDPFNRAGGGVAMNFPAVSLMPTPATAAKFLETVKTSLRNTLDSRLDEELAAQHDSTELSI